MGNIYIKINKKTRGVNPKQIFIGLDGENLQENVIFSFEDEFVDGQARIEVEFRDGTKGQITDIQKDGQTYVLPIKSEITKYSGCIAQLVIDEGTDENSIPIFKSLFVGLIVAESINASTPIPEGYTEWIDSANVKLNQMDTLNLDASKSGKVTSVIITRKDGTQEIVNINDGLGLEYLWQGTSLGIRNEGQSEYAFVNLKGDKGDAGSIKFIIVQVLPTENIEEDAMYLVPLANPESQENRFAEYIYVNGVWELLGKVAIQIDLSNYYTKQEVNALIPNELSDLQDDSTHRLVTDIEKNTWNGKANVSDIPTKTSDLTNDSDYTTKTYVDGLVGDINTALDAINGEVV